MKISVTDPWLGEREVGTYAELIKDQLHLLKTFRDDGRNPSQHLLDDIKVYEFILRSPNPNEFAKLYFEKADELRSKKSALSIKKMEVAKELGWEVL